MNVRTLTVAIAILASGLTGAAAAETPGSAARGKAVFARCAMCHSVEPGVNRMGPSLAGVVGRQAGSMPGFAYSPAMKSAKIRWDAKALNAFLTKPGGLVPGTRMAFAGLPEPADRAAVIAYLAKSNMK